MERVDPEARGMRHGRGRPQAVAADAAIALIAAYRVVLGPHLVGACRYAPSCSQYAEEAIRRFGLWRGGRMAVGRLLRCHPFRLGGWDPVPDERAR